MLINELSDDCLIAIFNRLNDLDDLINCYKVCINWSRLVAKRTKKVKYFIEGYHPEFNSFDCVYYQRWKPIDGTCLRTLFSNLKIADFGYQFSQKVESEDTVALVKNQESLKGLIHYYDLTDHSESLSKYCDNLEMISSNVIDPYLKQNGSSLKQLHLRGYALADFKRDAHYFPNLERLYIIHNIHENRGSPDSYYDGPAFERLKMLHSSFSSYGDSDMHYGFQFMDSCPNLKSAHIEVNAFSLFVDESFKHKFLQDLVLYVYHRVPIGCNELIRLLMKYPNLKHLSLRVNSKIKDEHIEQLVDTLPNLILLDVSWCSEITQRAADYVQDYCERHGRSIKFYFRGNRNEIALDWNQLSTEEERISRNFDFMKNCFFKGFFSLPCFLIY